MGFTQHLGSSGSFASWNFFATQTIGSGISRKRPTTSNKRHARQTELEALEVNVPVEKDDHVDVDNDYVDDDVSVEDDDVDNDIGVEADLMDDDVGVDDDNT